jgi:hypothetical protein
MLRKIFGSGTDETIAGWRRLHNDELPRNLYPSSIVRVFESKKIRWTGLVALMGLRGLRIRFWWES